MQLEDFLPMVLPYAPGCAGPIAEAAIRQAATEFCDRTDCWVQDLDETPTEAGLTDYELELDGQATMTRLIRVRVSGRDIPCVRRGDLPGNPEVSPLSVAIAIDRATLRILAAPTVDGLPILVTAVLAPSSRAVRLDDSFARPNANAIANGAIARLQMMPGKQYTDLRSAQTFEAKFTSAINSAKARAFYAGAHAPARVIPSYF